MRNYFKVTIKGRLVDDQTRCVHYHSQLDIIAIKFKCCDEYYPCYYCHAEEAGHSPVLWNKTDFNTKAILCGACKNELTIRSYLDANYECPYCHAPFNPRCRNHNHLYFEE